MNYNINYVFRLVDNFSGGASALAASMARLERASLAMGGAMAAVVAGGALVTMFGSATKAAGKWEAAMANVRRTADLSRDEMIAYGKDAMDLSVKLGTPVEKVADTMSRIAQTGVRDQKMLREISELATKAAVAWDDITPDQAARSIGKFGQIWFGDLGPDETVKSIRNLGDTINELSNRSNFKAPELLKYLDRASPIAKRFGLTAGQTSAFGGAVLATGVESGQMQGTRAEMSLRQLLAAATAPNKNQRRGFAALGMSPKIWENMIRANGQDALLNLMERFQKMDPLKRTGVANLLVGSRQGAQFTQLTDNLNEYKRQLAIADDTYARRFSQDKDWMDWLRGTGKFNDMVQNLEQYGKIVTRLNSLEREFAKRSDTLKFATAQRDAAWEKLKINMGMPFLEPLADLNRWLAGALDKMGTFVQNNPGAGRAAGYGIGLSLAAGLAAGVFAGLGATGSIGTRLLVGLLAGGAIGALGLTVTIALLGAGAWLFSDGSFWDKLSKPLDLRINFPNAPAWLEPFLKLADAWDAAGRQVRSDIELNRSMFGLKGSDDLTKWAMPSSVDADAELQSRIARFQSRMDPFSQFQTAQPLPELSLLDRFRGIGESEASANNNRAWAGGRDSIDGAQIAASIPQSTTVNVETLTRFEPARVDVNVTGQVNGPVQGSGSTNLQADPSRGSAMSAVGNAYAAPGAVVAP